MNRELARWLTATFYVIIIAVCVVKVITEGFDAYIPFHHPSVANFGYRYRSVAVLAALGLYAAMKSPNPLEALPLSFSYILCSHGVFETVHHVVQGPYLAWRSGLDVYVRNWAFIAFYLSQHLYLPRVLDGRKLRAAVPVLVVCAAGSAVFMALYFPYLMKLNMLVELAKRGEVAPRLVEHALAFNPLWTLHFLCKLFLALTYGIIAWCMKESEKGE